MERTIRANELIAIELVKAWCLQPTTATNTWDFGMVMNKYKYALKELDEMEAEERDNESHEITAEAYMKNVEELGRV